MRLPVKASQIERVEPAFHSGRDGKQVFGGADDFQLAHPLLFTQEGVEQRMRHFGQLAVAQGAEQVAEQALFQENFVNKGFDDGKVEIAAVFGNDPVGFVADDGGGSADEIAVQPLFRPLPVGLVIGLHGLDFIERVFQQLGNFSRVFQLFERKQDVLQKRSSAAKCCGMLCIPSVRPPDASAGR